MNAKKVVAVTATALGVVGMAAGAANASVESTGATVGSPGVLSGNLLQGDAHVPVNVCGNTADVIALLNPAFGNMCMNHG